jgi:alpha-beta hydrolase superfamily lysophospholipase
MQTTELTFLSHDGVTTIHGWSMAPPRVASGKQLPRAIVQIIHGAAEHSEPYSALAKYLVGEGFVVCAHDHIGHGRSVANASELGHMPAANGDTVLLEDTHSLRQLVQPNYLEAVPYIMLGHSMGSFILRVYASRYPQNLSAIILSGTCQPSMAEATISYRSAMFITKRSGERTINEFLHNNGLGKYMDKITPRQSEFDWLCATEASIDAYLADPLCGFHLTNGAYVTMARLIRRMIGRQVKNFTPRRINVLCISGALDPMAKGGKIPEMVGQLYINASNARASSVVVEGARHDIWQEASWKKTARTLTSWMSHWLGV